MMVRGGLAVGMLAGAYVAGFCVHILAAPIGAYLGAVVVYPYIFLLSLVMMSIYLSVMQNIAPDIEADAD